MVLGFKQQFVKPILNGTKIHTIREDKRDRWKPGRVIHFATGVRTKNYKQFHIAGCVDVQNIKIKYYKGIPYIKIGRWNNTNNFMPWLAKNDGFKNEEDFYAWFDKDFEGKIIHWTTKYY